ncbi:MAG: YicC/YloC family endoribonuclease, partial [Dictyoglomus sp.]
MKSMTASAFKEFSLNSLNFFLEVKGYNHRFLEIKVNLPDSLTILEKSIIDEIKRYVKRGYVSFSIRIIKDYGNLYKLNNSLLFGLIGELEKITGKKESIENWKEILGNPQIFYIENKVFDNEDYE